MNASIERHRPILAASLLSILFHLSMVSIFSIVIVFPKNESRFLSLSITERAQDSFQVARSEQLHLPALDSLVDKPGDPSAGMAVVLPQIELPRLKLPALTRLQNEDERLKIRSLLGEVFEKQTELPADSWAVFTQEMRALGLSLTGWSRPLGYEGAPLPETEEKPNRIMLSAPAAGLSLYIEWVSKPFERKLLFSPPIQVLWKLELAQLESPIMLMFAVEASGKVVNIQAPAEDEAGIVAAARDALANYRFDPIETEIPRVQRGMLVIAAGAPPP